MGGFLPKGRDSPILAFEIPSVDDLHETFPLTAA